MNDLVPTNGGNSLETHKASSSLVARGLSSLIDATKKDLDFEMGHNYWEGKNGYEQSEELALECFKKSAAKNNFEAMCDLALLLNWHLACGCLRDGSHTCGMNESAQLDAWESRTKESVGWLHKAALANHPRAQYELPGWVCYCDGDTECGEISCHLDKFGWFEKAVAQNYPPALLKMGLIKQPERTAFYLEKIEKLDSTHSEFAATISELARLYIKGGGHWKHGWLKEGVIKKDIKKGIALHLKAAKLDSYTSQLALAKLFSESKICEPHPTLAFNCCLKALLSKNGRGTEAALLLAGFYENGVGTDVKIGLSIAILERLVILQPTRYKTPEILQKINNLKQKLTHTNL